MNFRSAKSVPKMHPRRPKESQKRVQGDPSKAKRRPKPIGPEGSWAQGVPPETPGHNDAYFGNAKFQQTALLSNQHALGCQKARCGSINLSAYGKFRTVPGSWVKV